MVRFILLRDKINLSRYKSNTIELVVDRIPAELDFKNKDHRLRLAEASGNLLLNTAKDVVTVVN